MLQGQERVRGQVPIFRLPRRRKLSTACFEIRQHQTLLFGVLDLPWRPLPTLLTEPQLCISPVCLHSYSPNFFYRKTRLTAAYEMSFSAT